MRITVLALIFIFSLVSPAIGDSYLDTLRCRSGLIAVGANKLEVVSKCGQPTSKDFVDRPIRARGYRTESVQVELWTYNFGPNDFIHVFEIEGSTLTAIKRGARGF